MKKLFLAVLAWLCLALAPMNAQNDIEQQLLYMLSDVDTEPVRKETGILTDRVPNYVPIRLFDGKIIHDSLFATRENFILSYAILRNAHVGTLPVFSQDSLLHRLEYYEGKPLVPLGLMTYQYQKIKDRAVEEKLIEFDGEKFRVLVHPSSELFESDTIVMMCNLRNRYSQGLEVPFILPDFFRFGNLNVTNVSVDFGDGNGYMALNHPFVHRITYPEAGEYILRFLVTLASGELLEVKSKLEVTEGNSSFYINRKDKGTGIRNDGYSANLDGTKHFGGLVPTWKPIYDEYGNQIGVEPDYENLVPGSGAFVHYWLNKNCAEPKIRKPLIIISGFDPGNNYGPSTVINGSKGLLDLDYFLDKPIKDLIHDQNYDIFFINYVNSTIDIRENAAFVKQAVEWINAQKKANGSSEKNVILGVSMGGLVGKWMLQEFEMNGQDHEAQLFMTFDSPMRGANIPLALQALPLKFGNRKLLGIPLRNFSEELSNAGKTLSSKAAKQMLYYNLSLTVENEVSPGQVSFEHDAFFNEMDSRGELKVPYIPFSNGAITGTGQFFTPGLKIQKTTQQNPAWLQLVMLIAGLTHLEYHLDGYAIDNKDMIIHRNTLDWTVLGLVEVSASESLKIKEGFTIWDNAPGGLRTFEDRENGEIPNQYGWLYKSFCFIPTVSALDLRNVTDPFQTDLENIENTIRNFAPQIRTYIGSTETSIQFEEEQTNQEHVSLNNQLATFLLGNLTPLTLNGSVLNARTFNYGEGKYNNNLPNGTPLTTSRNISDNIHIYNNGKLWINRNDKIAYTDEPNLTNTAPKSFEVSLGKAFCDAEATEIAVDNGGEIFVGDRTVSNIGVLTIHEGTTLKIGPGGRVTIDHLSNIMVKKGGTIKILSDGTLDVLGDGKLIVEEGGNLILENGSVLNLEKEMKTDMLPEDINTGSVVVLHGKIHTNEDEIQVQGKGFIWVREKSSFSSATKKIKFIGHGNAYTAFRFDTETEMALDEFGFDAAKCMVNKPLTVIGAHDIHVNSSTFYSPLISFSYPVPTDYLLKLNNENKIIFIANEYITIDDSEFDDLPIVIRGFERFSSSNSDFSTEYKSLNVQLVDGIKSVFTNCNIYTNKPQFSLLPQPTEHVKKTGLNCQDVFETRISSGKITGFNQNNSRTEDPLAGIELIGIRHVNSPYLYLNNTEVRACGTGIFSPDGVNIIMDKSSIKDCIHGIDMIGKSDLGMVKMLCSSLENNRIGINGQDILLAIDGVINSQTTKNGFVTANYFDNINLHFSICYKLKNLDSYEIPARLNNWIDTRKYNIGFCGSQPFMELIQSPQSNGTCAQVEFSACNDYVPVFPLMQSGVNPNLYTGLCTSATCKGNPIMVNYWKGFSCFYNDNLLETEELFQPLAEEYFVDGNEMLALQCKSILKEANAFISGFKFLRYDSTASTVLQVKPSCLKTGANEFKTKLILHIPDWAKPYRNVEWSVSDGGVIHHISPDKLEILTNGIGKYLATVNDFECTYRGYYNFSAILQPPYSCPPACLTSTPVLNLDENSCTLFIQGSELSNAVQQSEVTFTLQRFTDNEWVNISDQTSYQVTEDGTYRYVVKVKDCEDVYSNFIVTSCTNNCFCFSETLVYNEESCNLSWTNMCDGFDVNLQTKSQNGTWTNLLQSPRSPFSLQIDGEYRLSFEKEGCIAQTSNSVITGCTLPGLCSCDAPLLHYNQTNCRLTWSQPICPGFSTTLERQSGGVWSEVSLQSPYTIPDNSNGNYRLVTRKPGCFPGHSNTVLVQCSCNSPDWIVLMDSGILGTDLWVEPYFPTTHVIPFESNVCQGGSIEFLLESSEVNQAWQIQAENSTLDINWTFTPNMAKVYLFLSDPQQSGETSVIFTSPCGDVYSTTFIYSCENECGNVGFNIEGSTLESCDNLTLNAYGGSHPYTFNIIGEGSLGTLINQTSSDIDLESLLPAETILLHVFVTDANGCTASDHVLYVRCAAGCNAGQCAVSPITCGTQITGGMNGYNENAIINYVVEEDISVLEILFNPLSRPQHYEISRNGNVILSHSSLGWSPTQLLCPGFNYFSVPNNQSFPASIGNLTKYFNWAKLSIGVSAGEVISVNISNPLNCNQSNWYLQFGCSDGQQRPDNPPAPSDEILNEGIDILSKTENIDERLQKIEVSLNPNPTANSTYLHLISNYSGYGEISIWNSMGQKLSERSIHIFEGSQAEEIYEMDLLPSGVYEIELKTPAERIVQRIIKVE